MNKFLKFLSEVAEAIEKERRRELGRAVLVELNHINAGRCNLCKQYYAGMAQDCECTMWGYSSWREAPRKLRPWYWKWWPESEE